MARVELAARLRGNGLQQVLFNAPPGDWQHGERGLAGLPGEAEFRAGVARALATRLNSIVHAST